jgi:hypothetical protein
MKPENLEQRCAFLERELTEVGIQLDAAQKRLRLADSIVDAVKRSSLSSIWAVHKAIVAWDEVPGDEGRKLHDTEGR